MKHINVNIIAKDKTIRKVPLIKMPYGVPFTTADGKDFMMRIRQYPHKLICLGTGDMVDITETGLNDSWDEVEPALDISMKYMLPDDAFDKLPE